MFEKTNIFIQNDLFLRSNIVFTIFKKAKFRWPTFALIYLFLFLGGLYVSQADQPVIRIFHGQELIANIFWLPTVFIIWEFYKWQVTAIHNVLSNLNINGIIGDPVKDSLAANKDHYLENLADFPRTWWDRLLLKRGTYISVVGSIFSLVLFNLSHHGYWWQDIEIFPYWALVGLLLPVYFLIWIIIRQIIAVIIFRRIFAEYHLSPKIFFHDNANGLASIGNFVVKVTFLALLAEAWVTAFVFSPVFTNNPLDLNSLNTFLIIFSISVVPAALFGSIWFVHKAMTIARKIELNQRSDVLNDKMKRDSGWTPEYLDSINQLASEYEFVDRHLKIWPFPFAIGKLAGIGLSYLLPFVVPIVVALISSKR